MIGSFAIASFLLADAAYAESSTGLGYNLGPLSITSLPTLGPCASTGASSDASKNRSDWDYDEDDVVYDKSVECRTETQNGETKIVCPVVCKEMDDQDKTYSSCLYACDNQKDGRACLMVADMYLKSYEYQAGFKYIEKGCALNDGEACFRAGLMPSTESKKMSYFEKGCKLNSVWACISLVEDYLYPSGSYQDKEKAFFYFDKSCGSYLKRKAEDLRGIEISIHVKCVQLKEKLDKLQAETAGKKSSSQKPKK